MAVDRGVLGQVREVAVQDEWEEMFVSREDGRTFGDDDGNTVTVGCLTAKDDEKGYKRTMQPAASS